jgi:hypothetical protein
MFLGYASHLITINIARNRIRKDNPVILAMPGLVLSARYLSQHEKKMPVAKKIARKISAFFLLKKEKISSLLSYSPILRITPIKRKNPRHRYLIPS